VSHRLWARLAQDSGTPLPSNYVQAWVGDRPRVRPTPDEWKTGAAPFHDELAALCPDRVVVPGKELWNQLPSPQESRAVTVSSDQIEIRFYGTSSHTAQAAMVHHPSHAAFSYARWQPVLRALLNGRCDGVVGDRDPD